MPDRDATTDPARRSFIEVAADSDFPIQNLPYGVFRPGGSAPPRVGVAIGEFVLDLAAIEAEGHFHAIESARELFATGALNALMARGRATWREVRATVGRLLDANEADLRDDAPLRERALLARESVQMLLPARIGDYTDFYSSREHATNVGTMFRGRENALMPNWLHVPVAYHGRSSSIVASGTPVRRPRGQTMPEGAERPVFGPSRFVDFELEMGFFIGPGNERGCPIPIEKAGEHIFGAILVNDWSARDIQRWEYVPLGPFLSKSFATSISAWVVPMDALEPFRRARPEPEIEPLPYLRSPGPGAFDIHLEAALQAKRMDAPHTLCRTNASHLYWSMEQQLAHHTVGGCNLRPGDLLASGTISGSTEDSFGSLLELAWRGERPLTLPGGIERSRVEDGDTVVMRGWCEGAGYRVGFGEVSGRLLPAHGEPGDDA